MKKMLLSLVILFVSVLCTACINNFAVNELNNKAKIYLENGDVDKAICRLRSSLDLDSSIFETNYNLGIAYIEAKNFEEAVVILKKAIEINPDFADSYYSLAVACESNAFQFIEDEKVKKTDEINSNISSLIQESLTDYDKYLQLKPNASDKDEVAQKIAFLENTLKKFSVD